MRGILQLKVAVLQHPQGGLREVERHVCGVPSQQRELRITRHDSFGRDREQDGHRQCQHCRSRRREAHRLHSSRMADDGAAHGQGQRDQPKPP